MNTKINKQARILLGLGGIFMGFGLFSVSLLHISPDISDFIKGIGVSFMIGAFFIARKPLQRG